MTAIAEWIAANGADWMKSHSLRRALAHPACPLETIDPEDLQVTMCDATNEDEVRRVAEPMDETTYRLHMEFVRSHGVPRGEYTTFSNTGVMKTNGVKGRE